MQPKYHLIRVQNGAHEIVASMYDDDWAFAIMATMTNMTADGIAESFDEDETTAIQVPCPLSAVAAMPLAWRLERVLPVAV